jgi:hypothetical protein
MLGFMAVMLTGLKTRRYMSEENPREKQICCDVADMGRRSPAPLRRQTQDAGLKARRYKAKRTQDPPSKNEDGAPGLPGDDCAEMGDSASRVGVKSGVAVGREKQENTKRKARERQENGKRKARERLENGWRKGAV